MTHTRILEIFVKATNNIKKFLDVRLNPGKVFEVKFIDSQQLVINTYGAVDPPPLEIWGVYDVDTNTLTNKIMVYSAEELISRVRQLMLNLRGTAFIIDQYTCKRFAKIFPEGRVNHYSNNVSLRQLKVLGIVLSTLILLISLLADSIQITNLSLEEMVDKVKTLINL